MDVQRDRNAAARSEFIHGALQAGTQARSFDT